MKKKLRFCCSCGRAKSHPRDSHSVKCIQLCLLLEGVDWIPTAPLMFWRVDTFKIYCEFQLNNFDKAQILRHGSEKFCNPVDPVTLSPSHGSQKNFLK